MVIVFVVTASIKLTYELADAKVKIILLEMLGIRRYIIGCATLIESSTPEFNSC